MLLSVGFAEVSRKLSPETHFVMLMGGSTKDRELRLNKFSNISSIPKIL